MTELSDIFQCKRCGFCCQGETTVSLDDQDQANMVAELKEDREQVAQHYWRITGRVVQMQIRDGHCIFYAPDSGCTIHRARPWRCRQWPLHPSILTEEANFLTIRQSCPGINQDMEYAAFCAILRQIMEEQGATLEV